MCSAPGKRASSFRIEDILKSKAGKRDRSGARTPERRQNIDLCDKARATGKKCEIIHRDESTLKKTLDSNHNSITETKHEENMRISNGFAQLINNEDARKSLDLSDHRRHFNHERISAFSGVDRFGSFGSRLQNCHSIYGPGRLSFPPTSPYYDSFNAAYNSVGQQSSWPLLSPSLLPYSSPSGFPFPPAYLRSYPHALPLAFTKRKGGQVRFTPQQTQNLERRFGAHKYLSPEDRRILAGQLKLSDRQVKTWFQNRRAKFRRANNTMAPEAGDPDSDNLSDEEQSSGSINREDMFRSPRNSPISVG